MCQITHANPNFKTQTRSKKAYLAWEIGAGRGHVVTLAHIARALRGNGMDCVAGLRSLDHAGELKGLVSSVHLGPTLPYFNYMRTFLQKSPAATYADFIGDLGYFSSTIISVHVEIWRRLITAAQPDIVICDNAPSALLAARSLGIPTATCGNAYATPPSNLQEMPVLLADFPERLWPERALCEAINTAIMPLDLPPLNYFAELFRGDCSLAWGINLLDPYSANRDQPLLAPPVEMAPVALLSGEAKDEVFFYLSVAQCHDTGIFEALVRLRVPRRIYVPGLTQDLATQLAAAGVMVEKAPVSAADIVRRSRILFHSGNFGILCQGIHLGIPQICMPEHLEHLCNARRYAATGAGTVIEPGNCSGANITAAILGGYEGKEMRVRVEMLARTTAGEFGQPYDRRVAEIVIRRLGMA